MRHNVWYLGFGLTLLAGALALGWSVHRDRVVTRHTRGSTWDYCAYSR